MSKGIDIKLTADTLIRLGFTLFGKNRQGRNIYHLHVPYYHSIIQMELGDYPRTNPNCGILSIYNPKEVLDSFDKKGKPTKVTFPERTIPISHYIDTPERLMTLIVSLTTVNV